MATATAPPQKTFLGQPRALATLFFTEMWERFSYYGMRAILALYLVAPPNGVTPPGGGLGMSASGAVAVYGTYSSLVYVLPLAGGWVSDRITGPRRSVLIGGIVIAIGHFMMAVPINGLFWAGLLVIAVGTGLLKPCVSAMVGDLYAPNDTRRDGGFSIFYMGINLGAFLAPLIVGTIGQEVSWHLAFALAGIGMLLGIGQYVLGWKGLGDVGKAVPKPATAKEKARAGLALVGALAFLALVILGDTIFFGFDIEDMTFILMIVVVIIAVAYFVRIFRTPGLTATDKPRLRAFLLLFLAAVIFWGIDDQSGSTLNTFAVKYTDTDIAGWIMPVSWLQSINPIFIIIFAPIFGFIWTKLADRAPSTPMKFAIALFGVALSFMIMIPPALAAQNGQQSAIWWLVAVYLVQTWSELLLSPNGLSVTTKLAPAGLLSQMLALWFLAAAVGDAVFGQIGRLIDILGFGGYFAVVGIGTAVMAGLFLLVVPRIRRLMEGVH